MNLKDFFNQQGYDIQVKTDYETYIDLWKSWYKGDVKGFHNYWIYNRPGSKVKRKRRTLQMAKKVSEDWADLLANEKLEIRFENEQDNETFKKIALDNNLRVLINQGIEKSFAYGTGALVGSIVNLKADGENLLFDEDTKYKAEFVEATKIVPLSWDNTQITECAFINYKTEKGTKYVYISMHVIENGEYVIKNFKYRYDNKQLSSAEDESLLQEFHTKSNIPMFTIIKPNICNNIDSDNPLGISIFANAISTLMNIDDIYDTKDLEVVLGRRKTFVSEDMLTYDDGKESLVFDPNDISVYVLPKGFNKDMFIQSDSTDLRTDKMIDDLNSELNVFSIKVGFGTERYKFDYKGDIQTATEVISENSDMYRTMKKHEILLEQALKTFVKSMVQACNNFTNYKFTTDSVIIDFDDSIIEDKNAEMMRAQNEVSLGLRSKKSYLTEIQGYTEQEADKILQEVNAEKTTVTAEYGF